MAEVRHGNKACTVNPLKMSQPIGAALAFLGLDRCLPLLHGSQGCTAFGLVLFVRHFRETIPLQTTAMNEVTTILGGLENIEQALLNIHKRAQPAVIGLCSTGLTETKGDDVAGFLKLIRARHPELADTEVVLVSTPDYRGAFQDGWGTAVKSMVEQLTHPTTVRTLLQVNILPGCHLTPGDIEEIREIVESFGLVPIILPDLSGSLDGHIPATFLPTTLGGTPLEDIRNLGEARLTIAIGEQMRPAAEALEKITSVPYRVFDKLTGLKASDDFIQLLAELSENEVPAKYRRQRSQLLDAMLDGHFHFARKKIALAAEPDLLFALGTWFAEMGAEIQCAVTTTMSPSLARLPCDEVLIGDLEDFERAAVGADLLVSHSHARQAAERLDIPLFRTGLPTFDRIGAAHRVSVGYRGTRDLIFEAANLFMAAHADFPALAASDPALLPTTPLSEAGRASATSTIHRH
ncbi:MAG: nitrogenase iron-molybdenum cofactor biosynthesis protein NifN [Betaproteobacteria bacterium]|nr:nitrogenase iron-molybdenum cofactor biosynthesis protein NifN [Betaproteobacteria bacterium]